jgi:hypothetical protein
MKYIERHYRTEKISECIGAIQSHFHTMELWIIRLSKEEKQSKDGQQNKSFKGKNHGEIVVKCSNSKNISLISPSWQLYCRKIFTQSILRRLTRTSDKH